MIYGMQKGPVKCADRAYVANVVAGFFDHEPILTKCLNSHDNLKWTRYADSLVSFDRWNMLCYANYYGHPVCYECFKVGGGTLCTAVKQHTIRCSVNK